MAINYNIMLWDTPIAEYRLSADYKLLQVKGVSAIAPANEKAIENWLKSRLIAVERRSLNKVFKGIPRYKLLEISMGLSLNDCLWVKREDSNLRFYQVNFYDNNFSEDLGIMSLFRKNLDASDAVFYTPELQTSGNLPKAWRTVNGLRYMFKSGLWGTENILEVVYEYPCSVIADLYTAPIQGLSAVRYELSKWDEFVVCYSQAFTNKYMSYFSCADMLNWSGIDLSKGGGLSQNNLKLKESLEGVIVFDYMVLNEDRHLHNVGYLLNSGSLGLVGLAPIYDSGRSFNFSQLTKVLNAPYRHKSVAECPKLTSEHKLGIKNVLENISVVHDAMYAANELAETRGGIVFAEDRTDFNMSGLAQRCKKMLGYK